MGSFTYLVPFCGPDASKVTCGDYCVIEHIMRMIAKFTDEQYTTINQSTAGLFDPRVIVNCLQLLTLVSNRQRPSGRNVLQLID